MTNISLAPGAAKAMQKAAEMIADRILVMKGDDPIPIPDFLRRPRGVINAIADGGPVGEERECVATDMRMVTLFLNEGGARGYLRVAEGNTYVHLLHVPTLEYMRMSIEEVGRCQMGDDRPVSARMADRLYDKAVQFEMHGMRYSRSLVSQALVKLGRRPLVDLNPAPVAQGGDAAPAVPASEASGLAKGSKAQLIADLLLRLEGCTTADVLQATGWPSVSMPAQAKVAGLALRKEKSPGQPTRYWGSAPAKGDLAKRDGKVKK